MLAAGHADVSLGAIAACHEAHSGFFKWLDSHKDHQELESLVQAGQAPWQRRS